MYYWGRFIGALFGFMLAGPVGILLGLFVGGLFDRGYGRSFNPFVGHSSQIQAQQTYFRVAFQVMGHIAKADGRVSENEIRAARTVMRRMNLNKKQTLQAIQYFNDGKQPRFDLILALDDLLQACHQQRILLQMFIEMQFQAALVDGLMNQRKQQILETLCQRLGMGPIFQQYRARYGASGGQQYQQHRSYQQPPRQPRYSIDNDYALLEITANASTQEVKKAYRKLMSQNHPDKLISQGLPEEMIKLATDKTQKISAAYERIMKTRK